MTLSLREWTGNKLGNIITVLEKTQKKAQGKTNIPRSGILSGNPEAEKLAIESTNSGLPPITPEFLGQLTAIAEAMESTNTPSIDFSAPGDWANGGQDSPELATFADKVTSKVAQIQKAAAPGKVGTKSLPSMNEISSSKSEIYGTYHVDPYNPDDLVGKKGLKIYKSLKNDDQVKAVLATKKATRLATRWKIIPGTTAKSDQDIADFVRWNLENMEGTLESDLYEILSALEYGFSVTEIVWRYISSGPWKGKLGLKALKTRQPFNFHFQTDDHDNLEYILQRATKGDIQLPPDKFIVYSHNKTFDNFYGESELRAVYRNIFSKDIILKFWNLWLERYPSPVTLGYYPTGTPKAERDDLLTILKRIQIATAAILPENLEVEFIQNPSVGHAVFKEAIEFHNKSITRGLLVPDLLGFTETTGPGSYALGKTHFDVYMSILNSLGREIEETILFEQLIKPMVNFNFSVSVYPHFRFEAMTEEGVEARAKVLQMLVQAKIVDPKEPWVREYLNMPGSQESYNYSEGGLERFTMSKSPPIIIPGQENQESITVDPKTVPEIDQNTQDQGEHRFSTDPSAEPLTAQMAAKSTTQKTPTPYFSDPPSTWRKLTVFETAGGFNPGKTLEMGETWLKTAADSISDSVSGMITDAIKQIRSKKLLSGRIELTNDKAYRSIQEIKINPREVRSRVLNSLIYGYFQGKETAFNEVEKSLGKKLKFSEDLASPTREDLKAFVEIDSFPEVLPAKAIEAFKSKLPLLLLKRSFASLLQREKTIAFSVAGIIEKDTLINIQELLIKAMEGGWTLDEFEHQVRVRSIQYTGEAYGVNRAGEPMKAYHLETILRTNYSDVFNQGRRNLMNDPDVVDFVPALQYSGILDSRIRITHKRMDMRIYLRTDPIWRKWYPPCGYSCRCIVIPVTVNQDFTISKKAPSSLVPDIGFGGIEEEIR